MYDCWYFLIGETAQMNSMKFRSGVLLTMGKVHSTVLGPYPSLREGDKYGGKLKMAHHRVAMSCCCCRRSTFDIFNLFLKLTISAESPKRFSLNHIIEGYTSGKVVVEIQAQNITYVVFPKGRFQSTVFCARSADYLFSQKSIHLTCLDNYSANGIFTNPG